jgi:5'-nucleotidase
VTASVLPVIALLAVLPTPPPEAARSRATAPVTVRLLGFADYHSHAVPFYSEGRVRQGGIARAIAFLKAERERPGTLVVSGGDMLNQGSPAWSDVFGCVEWPWLAGLVDMMALGNHDLDYGADAFERCRAAAPFPILSANVLDARGRPALAVDGKPYLVRTVSGVRIGLFAVAGPDFPRLVPARNLPEGWHFADPVETARAVVARLRREEQVAAVVLVGHQSWQDDARVARAVPGIDLVLGSHSHRKAGLATIPGTRTSYVSPYQYLAYVARVELDFRGGRLAEIRGGLVPMDVSQPEDLAVAAEVARRVSELRSRRPERFEVVGVLPGGLSDAGIDTRDAPIGTWATEAVRRAASLHAFVAPASSFRGGLAPGEVTAEDFHNAIPYRNAVLVAELTGAQVRELVDLSLARRGTDFFSQKSGLAYEVENGRAAGLRILRDPARPRDGYAKVDPRGRYRIGVTDFQARVAPGYRDLFARVRMEDTELDVHRVLLDALSRSRPARSPSPSPPAAPDP